MLNRSVAPTAMTFHHIPLPNYKIAHLDNGIPVYYLQYGSVEVCEVQAVFKAGGGYASKVGLSDFTPRMLSEGTRHYSSLALAEVLDNYGASLDYDETAEFISLNLTALTRLLPKTLPLLAEIINVPTFPESEFEKIKQRTIQKLIVSHKKSAFIASVNFPKMLFGESHCYGVSTDIAEIKALNIQDLIQYHNAYLHTGNMYLCVCGQFNEKSLLNRLNMVFGKRTKLEPANQAISAASLPFETAKAGRYHKEVEGVQSSLRIGQIGIARNHPDATKMEFVNTVLGGYFGSKLMKNIREEKGYTYGVYSSWAMMRYAGYFAMQCDVGTEYVEATIEEMKKEVRNMQEKPISQGELDLVRNYKLGKSISERETPFQLNNLIRFSVSNGISFEQIDEKYSVFEKITPDEIQALAQKYWNVDNWIELVCGKK